MEENRLDFAAAREAVTAGNCFTTHTPVPAGNDIFAPQLIEQYFSTILPQLKIDRNDFLGLGRQNPRDPNEPFCMTVLAIRLAHTTNGVSKLHGQVSRKHVAGHLARSARKRDPHRLDHQRRPHPHLGVAGHDPAL